MRQENIGVISRRDFMAAVAAGLAGTASASAAAGVPSLKDACKEIFRIGTALDFRTPNEFSAVELDLIKSQFNVITPENSMNGPCAPSGELLELDAARSFG